MKIRLLCALFYWQDNSNFKINHSTNNNKNLHIRLNSKLSVKIMHTLSDTKYLVDAVLYFISFWRVNIRGISQFYLLLIFFLFNCLTCSFSILFLIFVLWVFFCHLCAIAVKVLPTIDISVGSNNFFSLISLSSFATTSSIRCDLWYVWKK